MIKPLNTYLTNCLDISAQEQESIETFFQKKTFPKKTLLLQAGEVCKFEGFIIKGCIKTYFIGKEGEEVVLTFATENWWISDITSFQEQTASNMFIQTMEETELLILSPQTKEALLTQHPKLEKMFRLMVQRHLRAYQERLFGNIALTAEDRYERFLKKHPSISQRVPQHLIASYLGISPEFLSRIRRRKIK